MISIPRVKSALLQSSLTNIVVLTITLIVPGFYLFAQATREQGSQSATPNESSQSSFAKCLPTDVKLNDLVEASVTVQSKLNELKATCSRDNQLIDRDGNQVIFYHRIGCWGNPPADYQELLEKQRDEINKLKQQFTVIEMSCNPSGARIQ